MIFRKLYVTDTHAVTGGGIKVKTVKMSGPPKKKIKTIGGQQTLHTLWRKEQGTLMTFFLGLHHLLTK